MPNARFTVVPSNDHSDFEPSALTKQEFGRRLQDLMLGKGWNQSELARQAEIGRDSVSAYVNGRQFPNPPSLEALSRVLGVTPDELLPNGFMRALDAEHPAVELKVAAGHPERAWLRINREVPFDVATAILSLINDADRR